MKKDLEFLLDNIPAPALVIDKDKLIVAQNEKMTSILECHGEENFKRFGNVLDVRSKKYLENFCRQTDGVVCTTPHNATLVLRPTGKNIHVELSWKKIEIGGLSLWLVLVYPIDELRKEIIGLKFQATRDELTGVENRWSFFSKFEQEIRRAKRYRQNLSLVLIDVDNFKRINDSFGHRAGDVLLQSLACSVSPLLRDSDVFGRLGGDEFAILMPSTDIAQAREVANRINHLVSSSTVRVGSESIYFSISLGVASSFGKEIEKNSLLDSCDVALYKAKKSGRNTVMVH
ncbi:MAG: GGDEF domain-containing protein [Gammaproteobacteria bacterium]|nr:GGDEF domain-containing protein [Gammaproteobacteria bacterium]